MNVHCLQCQQGNMLEPRPRMGEYSFLLSTIAALIDSFAYA